MYQCTTTPTVVQLVIATLAALNVGLATWLAHRRYMADKREHKRNGDGHAQHSTVAERLYPSDSTRSAPGSNPKS